MYINVLNRNLEMEDANFHVISFFLSCLFKIHHSHRKILHRLGPLRVSSKIKNSGNSDKQLPYGY